MNLGWFLPYLFWLLISIWWRNVRFIISLFLFIADCCSTYQHHFFIITKLLLLMILYSVMLEIFFLKKAFLERWDFSVTLGWSSWFFIILSHFWSTKCKVIFKLLCGISLINREEINFLLRLSTLINSNWYTSACIIFKEMSILDSIPYIINTILSNRRHFLMIHFLSSGRSRPSMTATRWIIPSKRWELFNFPLLAVILLLKMSLVHVRHVLRRWSLKYFNLIIVLLAHKEIIVFLCCEYRLFLLVIDYTATSLLLLFHTVIVLLLDSSLNLLLSGCC